jgi:hypothetical protein
LRTSVTCQPKCQIADCGVMPGALSTLLNSTSTLFGDASAAKPPQLDFEVLANCRV